MADAGGSPARPTRDAEEPLPGGLDILLAYLRRVQWRAVTNEGELQEDAAALLRAAGFTVVREVPLGPAGRIDLVVGDTIGIECKVRARTADVLRQLRRYHDCGRFEALVLLTASARTHLEVVAATPPVPRLWVVVARMAY